MVDEAKGLDSQVFSVLEKIRAKGGVTKKGINEVTKVLERGQARLVVYASDVSPKEIIMHIPLLSKDKNVPCVAVSSKVELRKVYFGRSGETGGKTTELPVCIATSVDETY